VSRLSLIECLGPSPPDRVTVRRIVYNLGRLERAPDPPREDMHQLPQSALVALESVLETDERVDLVAPAVGSELVLTDRRLIVLRHGAQWRPTSGIRSFALDRGLQVRIAPTSKQVIIQLAGVMITVFIRHEQVTQAQALLAEVRRRIYAE
jgi:hypothetical protein